MTGKVSGNGSGSREFLPQGSRPLAPSDTEPSPVLETAMAGTGPQRRVVRIVNPNGLHFRVADRFSKLARQYVCAVTVWNGDTRADGTSLTDLIMLIALPDSEVVLEVDGPDALKAVDPLASVLASPGGEDYTI